MDVDEISTGSCFEGYIALRPFRSKRFHPSACEPLVGLKIKHANEQFGMIVGGNFNENGAFGNISMDCVSEGEPLQVKIFGAQGLAFAELPE